MSVLDAAERFASIDRSQIVLDASHCLHSQDQYSDCAACYDICPANAIRVGTPPSLHVEVCQSCLACIPVCPVGAYHADDDVADLLNCATHVENQPVELLCGLHPHPEMGIEAEAIGIKVRGCLAGLGTGAYVALSILGLTHVLPRTDACPGCKWYSLSPEISCQVKRVNQFLSAWDKVDVAMCVENVEKPVERVLWSAKNPPLSRRDLFRMVARQGQVAMARAMENGKTTIKRQPGRDRTRLVRAVSHLPEPSANVDLQGFGFATLAISDHCTACGACANACPTEALYLENDTNETSFSISFFAPNCIGCNICDHVCMPEAITFKNELTFDDVFGGRESRIVASGELVRCERCKTLMAKRDDVTLCPLCEYRRKNPFGSMVPKKILKESRS